MFCYGDSEDDVEPNSCLFCSHLNTRCSQQHEKQRKEVRYLAKRCILYNGIRPDISWAAWPLTFRWPTLKYLPGCPPHPSLLNTPLSLPPLFQPSPSLPAPTALVAPTVRTSTTWLCLPRSYADARNRTCNTSSRKSEVKITSKYLIIRVKAHPFFNS